MPFPIFDAMYLSPLDIKYDDIDEELWKSGMAMNRGYDAAGQNVVILQISKHRKDSKKAAMLRKWIAFCYEMHVRKQLSLGGRGGGWRGRGREGGVVSLCEFQG